MYATNDRGATREVFFRAWRNHLDQKPLEGVERLLVQIALRHPEYQALLEDPQSHLERDYAPALGETNPFLHMAMHLAIEEQLTLDEPRGIRDVYQAMRARLPDEHEAQHRMMGCLAESIYQMQRRQRDFDAAAYIECLTRRATARR
jgi:hypothetical protein